MTIMKQLIEGMIGDYLNESYEDDLVESIFEEVSEETWEAIEEAILNELSPELLKRYQKSAEGDKRIAKKHKGAAHAHRDYEGMDDMDRLYNKRDAGQKLAQQKINQKRMSTPIIGAQRADFRKLSSTDFEKKYNMTKSEWQRKNK